MYGFANAIFSGLTTNALARVLEQVALDHQALGGVYHVAAAPIAKFELLERLRDGLGLHCEIRAMDEPSVNRALDSTRFRAATGIEPPSWDEMLDGVQRGSAMKPPLDGSVVLITGGTGSLGQTLVRRLLRGDSAAPAQIIVFSRDEAKQYAMKTVVEARPRGHRRDRLPQLRRAARVPHRRRARLCRASSRGVAIATSSFTPPR